MHVVLLSSFFKGGRDLAGEEDNGACGGWTEEGIEPEAAEASPTRGVCFGRRRRYHTWRFCFPDLLLGLEWREDPAMTCQGYLESFTCRIVSRMRFLDKLKGSRAVS